MALTDAQKAKLVKLGQLAKFKELADARYQLVISDLSTIRSGAAAGATAYQLPENGIPSTDLAQAVQDALTAAGTALQASDLETLNGKVAALESLVAEGDDPTSAIDKFNEIVDFLNHITNTETLEGIVSGINTSISAKYTKPNTGIPLADLASDVQTSLGKADTALQTHQSIKTINGASMVGSGDVELPAEITSNPESLTSEQCEALKIGDIVIKSDSTGKHSYVVSFKSATGMCLTYSDAENIETISYDKVSDVWGKTDKTVTNIAAGLANAKTKQTAVTDPTANGTAIEFIASFTQNANGDAVVTKKTVQSATPYVDSNNQGQAGLLSAADKAKVDELIYADDTDIAALF